MNLTDLFSGLRNGTKASDVGSPESSPGGPVYDAKIDPAIAETTAVENTRLQLQRNYHLFYGKTAAAQAFSHYYEGQPSQTAVAMQGLGEQAALLDAHFDRQWAMPFPGQPLGHVPSFAPSPSTNPVTPPIVGKTHHAHRVENRRSTRARFGS